MSHQVQALQWAAGWQRFPDGFSVESQAIEPPRNGLIEIHVGRRDMPAINVKPTVLGDGAEAGSRLWQFRKRRCRCVGRPTRNGEHQGGVMMSCAILLPISFTCGARFPEARPCAISSG